MIFMNSYVKFYVDPNLYEDIQTTTGLQELI